MAADSALFSSKNINGIYIPVGLLIFGTFIVKREWVPYAALVAVALGAFKLYGQRALSSFMLELARC
jgi:cytochrome-b5 reductase